MHHYATRQKLHLPSEPHIVWDGEIVGVVETEVGLLVGFSKIVKICYNLYVRPKENYE
jgi:hypothetical protein